MKKSGEVERSAGASYLLRLPRGRSVAATTVAGPVPVRPSADVRPVPTAGWNSAPHVGRETFRIYSPAKYVRASLLCQEVRALL